MSSSDTTTDTLFDMAGIKKNVFSDRWEFFWGSSSSEAETTTVDSSRCSADDGSLNCTKSDDQVSIVDGVDLTSLRIGDGVPTASNRDDVDGVIPKIGGGKKKKKKKSASVKSTLRSVKWGNVEQILFTRMVSYCGVPTKGGYPLGLGQEVERTSCTIDQLFYAQQCQLRERANRCGIKSLPMAATEHSISDTNTDNNKENSSKSKKTKGRSRSNSIASTGSDNNSVNSATVQSSIDVSRPLETRQFDYKSTTNPLFYSLDEDKRILMLTTDTHPETTIRSTRSNSLGVEPSSSSNVFTEINNDIRTIKSIRGQSGCSCKHTKVDKLSVAKLKSELLNNCHLTASQMSIDDVDKLSKPELMQKVKDTLRFCVMCVDNDCACVQQEIPCSSQLCGCLRAGYHPGESQSCANPEGRDTYDLRRVQDYRRDLLARLAADGKSS